MIAVGILQIVRRLPSSPGRQQSRTLALAAGVARRAYQRRSILAFYVLAAGVMWLLSLGPAPTLRGTAFWVKAPYSWLMVLPGFSSLRVPARFAGLMILCLSMAAGLTFARLVPLVHKRRLVLVGVIGIGILADTWIRPLPTFAAPRPLDLLETAPPAAAVLELPLGDEVADSEAVFRSIYHHLPVVNGYSGYFPPHYGPLTAGLEEHDDEMLTALAVLGPIAIVVNERSDADRGWTRYVTQHAGRSTDRIEWHRDGLLVAESHAYASTSDRHPATGRADRVERRGVRAD